MVINRHGAEVLFWDQNEWEEDSSQLFPILLAVKTALTDPKEMDSILRRMGKLLNRTRRV